MRCCGMCVFSSSGVMGWGFRNFPTRGRGIGFSGFEVSLLLSGLGNLDYEFVETVSLALFNLVQCDLWLGIVYVVIVFP